ncbi:Hypothetical Protein CGB_I3520W [Cryptococcus gattii WM276]|uniref:Uncharacterized protein n=2 Tax=Cryptococcus gattii TaxID=37769 RepID=E6RCC8_CRYGW|nr:Hypothetical Protein CGB_I3520W [Cryptococcus gattii WM276]ADV24422.1 Hypothetical Protein CGB_I3520W [Cryptococcus gattii WM276]KIR76272.1 hypothetical protein I306_06808 [Cryptococcus gattii EJB2]KJE02370.1 hypothetical protein I311_03959 [Cryptococcus gattii NT-10]
MAEDAERQKQQIVVVRMDDRRHGSREDYYGTKRSSRTKKDIRSERCGVRELQMRAIYPTVADMGGGGILSRCSILYP